MRVISPSVTCAHTTLLGSSLTFGSLPVSYFQQLQASLFLSLSLVFCQNQCSLWPFSDSITQHLFQLLVTLSGHHHWLSLIQTADHPIGVLPQRSPNPTSFILIEAGTQPDTHDFFSLILHAMSVFTTCEYVTTPFWTMCTVLPSLYPIYPSLQQYQISSLSFLHFSELFGVILSLANPWTTMPQATYPKWFQVGTTLSCCQFLIPP